MSHVEWIYGYHALRTALQTSPDKILQIYVQSGRQDSRMKAILQLAKQQGIVTVDTPLNALNQMANGQVHQGMLAQTQSTVPYTEHDLMGILSEESSPLLLLLDSLQDPHNLGACLRSANAFGVCAVIAPKDRAVGITPVVEKVACGAAALTPFVPVTNLVRTMQWLKKEGIWIVGTDGQSTDEINSLDLKGPMAIVMGNEGSGMRRLVREQCDFLARIDMPGDVSSLNVSVATGVCLYEAHRQRSL
ncbi:MAG: 23S rRNA (guanosine(2251)-2'-O)-methyltransferase RlmB [Legionellales bacterium]|mgnify:CR=1 FL=1|nr:23S rRNA (guanosine(2251)-2'-O)-methyltransferase RlmB [Legionellales bacterium]HAG62251.1 23S rRNA (guanosine(2251)-2'-O)-methyltransferase RlmB [Coxiellaceae bacterium]